MAARTFYPRCTAILRVLMEDFADGSAEDVFTYTAPPVAAKWDRTHAREADTFEIKIEYRDLPVDPRTVRGVQVLIYADNVDDPTTSDPGTDDSILRFSGFVDRPETSLGPDGEFVTMRGRDLTALFLDKEWTGGALDISRPLSRVIEAVKAEVPGAEEVTVEFDPEADDVTLSAVLGRTRFVPKRNDDAWTILVDLCGRVGLVPVIDLDTLRIQPAGKVGGTVAAMVYGQNIARLELSRKLRERRTAQVRVVAWNEQTKAATEATYPETAIVTRKKISATGKVSTDTAPIITFALSGSYSADQLLSIAQNIYEESAREQFAGELQTFDLTDVDGVSDLMALKNGDSLVLTFDNQADVDAIETMSQTERIEFLLARGVDEGLAGAISLAIDNASDLSNVFYVKRARHEWTREGGYSLSVSFLNYAGTDSVK